MSDVCSNRRWAGPSPACRARAPSSPFCRDLHPRTPRSGTWTRCWQSSKVREHGYATSDEELDRGVVAASIPVYNFTSRVVAALNVSAPNERIGVQLDKLGRIVASAVAHPEAIMTTPALFAWPRAPR
ncbi:IclR family transcriptional regulator domain-containing protein [Lentzea kentuckyensis]|uniref:IclR family transcriptional regulator domain-containing protein n=1 Tax=Lentzea kentuckyensis TaxID=360086 RepID=UPI000A3A269B|nr:IclR family transcriptional regulator C-terminal domain-containing protein [Lentzea kentuckyensis]